jgi:hypothetical protein
LRSSGAAERHPLPPGCPSPTHQRRQQAACFIEKSDRCPATPRRAEPARQRVRLPAFYLLGRALACPHLRLGAGPVPPTPKQSPDLVRVLRDAEVSAAALGHTGRGPQFVGAAVGRGSLEKEALQVIPRRIGQPASGTGSGLGGKILPLPSPPSPAMQGRRPDAQKASANRGCFTLRQQLQRTAAPLFQLSSCPFGSHTSILLTESVFRKVGRSKWADDPSQGNPIVRA